LPDLGPQIRDLGSEVLVVGPEIAEITDRREEIPDRARDGGEPLLDRSDDRQGEISGPLEGSTCRLSEVESDDHYAQGKENEQQEPPSPGAAPYQQLKPSSHFENWGPSSLVRKAACRAIVAR
jgi:hypothetical protein